MCGTCGCSDANTVTITDPVTGEHTHVLPDGRTITHSHDPAEHRAGGTAAVHEHVMPDGTVVRHTHASGDPDHEHEQGHRHSHAQDHDGGHGHGHGHTHGATEHSHLHTHTHTHTLPDGTVVEHAHAHDHGGDHGHGDSHGHGHGHEVVSMAASVHGTTQALEAKILEKNDRLAERNRAYFVGRKLLAVNLMSSPGAGKTTLLEKTLKALEGEVAVLEGDQETANDAERIRATGAPVLQINTGTGCHLEADMVWAGVQQLDPPTGGTLFIENVGNLVCPALFDLGEDAKVVLFSTTEGEDKPLKYPHMFRRADLVILTKTDLVPHLDFDHEAAIGAVRAVAPDAEILELSSKSGEGMDAWLGWLTSRREAKA
jgi:hydrogenase nickel incorporation protein HypB